MSKILSVNQERAERAGRALDLYSVETVERDDALTDLLTDLQHYCHSQNMDWEGALEVAEMHFRSEQLREQFQKQQDAKLNDKKSEE